jgi:putative endonuclease
MPGLAPDILVFINTTMKGGWFYLMTNRRNGILYAGVTGNLPRRAFEHRQGLVQGFTTSSTPKRKSWMAGTSPAMTLKNSSSRFPSTGL